MLYILGFGSLCFSPELPERVEQRFVARIDGVRRAFNKASASRRIARRESFDAFPDSAPRRFLRGEVYQSLVLGTEQHLGAHLDGFAIGYPDVVRGEALALTDAREGYDAARAPELNGYVRATRAAQRFGEAPGAVDVEIYLSNPHPRAAYRVDTLSLDEQARVLINGTPRQPSGPDDSRGLYYLERTREALLGVGIVDAQLEALAAVVRSHDGPWREVLSAPRSADGARGGGDGDRDDGERDGGSRTAGRGDR